MEIAKNPILPASATAKKEAFDRPLKARNPNLYYENLYIKCYYFCQQCEDYFETVEVKGHRHIPFATSFLKEKILFCRQQYKSKIKQDSTVLLIWDEFKAFLKKALGNLLLLWTASGARLDGTPSIN